MPPNCVLSLLKISTRMKPTTLKIVDQEECSFVRKYLAERTTIWREPFWALLSKKDQLKVAQCVKLRMVPSDAEPHDFVAADSASGCMIFSSLKGAAQVHIEQHSLGAELAMRTRTA